MRNRRQWVTDVEEVSKRLHEKYGYDKALSSTLARRAIMDHYFNCSVGGWKKRERLRKLIDAR